MEIDTTNKEERRWVKEYEQKMEERGEDITGNGEDTVEVKEGTGDCRSSRGFEIRDTDYIMCWRNFEDGETAAGMIEQNAGTC